MDGDYNKDGKDDVITGSPDANDKGTDSGNIEIWYGASPLDTGSRILVTGPEPAPGVGAGDHFGSAVAFVDYNGDGRAEVLGGAPDGNLPTGETVGLAAVNFYPGTLVPVALTGFEAQWLDGGVLLHWFTRATTSRSASTWSAGWRRKPTGSAARRSRSSPKATASGASSTRSTMRRRAQPRPATAWWRWNAAGR